jgi:Pyruvate/2-oxoacid:ferredoxin oxidoreductase delta subunit
LPESRPENIRFACLWQCGICIAVCGDSAISHSSDGFEIDLTACSGCMVCVKTCPAGIIGEDLFA